MRRRMRREFMKNCEGVEITITNLECISFNYRNVRIAKLRNLPDMSISELSYKRRTSRRARRSGFSQSCFVAILSDVKTVLLHLLPQDKDRARYKSPKAECFSVWTNETSFLFFDQSLFDAR